MRFSIFDFGFSILKSEIQNLKFLKAIHRKNWCFKPVKEQGAHTMHLRPRFSSNFLHQKFKGQQPAS